jgi:hypothetical protein
LRRTRDGGAGAGIEQPLLRRVDVAQRLIFSAFFEYTPYHEQNAQAQATGDDEG